MLYTIAHVAGPLLSRSTRALLKLLVLVVFTRWHHQHYANFYHFAFCHMANL